MAFDSDLVPQCFVLTPLAGEARNFENVYQHIIVPSIEHAGLEPDRIDVERGRITCKERMLEKLLLSFYVIADITAASSIYYALSVRQAYRPWNTVVIFAEGTIAPFDVEEFRAITYQVDGEGRPVDADKCIAKITERLRGFRMTWDRAYDSPVAELIHSVRETF